MNGYEELMDKHLSTNYEFEAHRQEAMDTLMAQMYNPLTVGNFSQEIERLLAEDSEYLRLAGEQSRAEAEQRGMLESEFMEDVGRVQAIDRVFDVAKENVYADTYNAMLENQKMYDEFQVAWAQVGEEQWTKGNVAYAEWKSYLEDLTNTSEQAFQDQWSTWYDEMAEKYQDQYHNVEKEWMDQVHEYQMDMYEKQQDYNKMISELSGEYEMELEEQYSEFVEAYMDQENAFASYRSDKMAEYQKNLEDSLSYYEDIIYQLRGTKAEAMGQWEKYKLAQARFFDEQKEILNADMSVEEKQIAMDALVEGFNQWNEMFSSEGSLIEDNVWDLETIEGIRGGYTSHSKEILDFYPTIGDMQISGSWNHAKNIIQQVDVYIHENFDRSEYKDLPVYQALEFVRGECDVNYENCTNGFDDYLEKNPEAGKAITDWYKSVSSNIVNNAADGVIIDWANLMTNLAWKNAPGGWESFATTAYNMYVPLENKGELAIYTKYDWDDTLKTITTEDYYTDGENFYTKDEIIQAEQSNCIHNDICEFTDLENVPSLGRQKDVIIKNENSFTGLEGIGVEDATTGTSNTRVY